MSTTLAMTMVFFTLWTIVTLILVSKPFVVDGLLSNQFFRIASRCPRFTKSSAASLDSESATTTTTTTAQTSTLRLIEWDGWKMAFQHKPATSAYEQGNPILLIHPVGIGLSSWFWNKFIDAWEGPSLIAVDLLGCGIQHGADPWDPDKKGLSIPLSWVKACEALMYQIGFESSLLRKKDVDSDDDYGGSSFPYSVVVQGGLATVGVVLASRNPTTVEKLILTSPPTWPMMTTAIPQDELNRNYSFLRSNLGRLAFRLLESRWATRLFSNLILFAEKCDETWLDQTMRESCEQARPPVQVFNAGILLHRSYEQELRSLKQPTLILEGSEDKARRPQRLEYVNAMESCTVQMVSGKNVLPWESPKATADAILKFVNS